MLYVFTLGFRKEHVTELVTVPSSAFPVPTQDDIHSYFSGAASCNLPSRWVANRAQVSI